MGRPVLSGFELVAKRDRRVEQADQPTVVSMRPERRGEQRRNPSTDQKKVIRERNRRKTAADEESSMTTAATEADLLAAMATAAPADRRKMASQLAKMRADAAAKAQTDRQIDFARTALAWAGPTGPTALPGMSPRQVTAESDWLSDVVPDEAPVGEVVNSATAEASLWFDRLHEAVRQDDLEFHEQAQGMAWRVAGQFGTQAQIGHDAFMRQASRLRSLAANPDIPPPSAYAPITNGSTLPPAVDNDKTFDAEITPATPSTKVQPPATPSLAEGSTPEGDSSQGSGNPLADQANFDKASPPPLTDYLTGDSTPWKGSSLHTASVRPEMDEWVFMQHTAEDQDTADVKGQAPSLAEGGPIAGDAAESTIERGPELGGDGDTVKDGGNANHVDPLNGTTTTPEGKVSSLRTISALARAIQDGEATRGRLLPPQARNFVMALSSLDTADETFGGVPARAIIGYLNATVGELSAPQSRQALAELQRHLAEVPPQFRKKNDDDDDDKGDGKGVPSNVDDEDKDKFREQQDGVNGDSKSDPDDDGKAEDGSSNTDQKDDDSDDDNDDDDSKDKDSSSSDSNDDGGSDDDKKKKSLPPWMQNKQSAFAQRVQANLAKESGFPMCALGCGVTLSADVPQINVTAEIAQTIKAQFGHDVFPGLAHRACAIQTNAAARAR